MNCTSYTLAGLNIQCSNSIGGISQIYFGYRDELIDVHIEDNKVIPLYNGKLFEYKLRRGSSSMTSNLVTSDNSSSFFQTELTMSIGKMETMKRFEMMALLNIGVFAIIKDANNNYWFLGKDSDLEMSAGTATTGTNNSDANEYSFTLMDESKELPFELAPGVIEDLTTDYEKEYLTFEAVRDAYVNFARPGTEEDADEISVYVSKDKINWREIESDSAPGTTLAHLNAGEKLYVKGYNSNYGYYSNEKEDYVGYYFHTTDDCYVYGNIMSLIYGEDFENETVLESSETFTNLFSDYDEYEPNLISIHPNKKLVLPATTLTPHCYQNMFAEGYKLTIAPELPAMIMEDSCYSNMFRGTSLIKAPELPASTLAEGCYREMFYQCSKLLVAPKLPATTLANSCYSSMFRNCSSLTTAPELPATTLTDRCYSGMFWGCTSLSSAPELPATTLKPYCYNALFRNCTRLSKVKCNITSYTSSNGECTFWLQNVSPTGTFYKNASATNWPFNDSGIPSGWTVQNL